MCRFFILFLLVVPTGTLASENLIENMRRSNNADIIGGVVHQVAADSRQDMQWKIQAWYNNRKHEQEEGTPDNISYERLVWCVNNQIGFISMTFVTPSDLEDLKYFRFGLNGQEHDTCIFFNIKDVMPSTVYTIQWRLINSTQGEVSWTDMLLVHCADGYSLALGDTNCSRMCENQSVDGGYILPNVPQVYEPEICTYHQSQLVCDAGYVKIDTVCEKMCTAGITRFHVGGASNGLYAHKAGSPALAVQYNGQICYGHLVPGTGVGLNVNLNGMVYHLID